MDKSILVKKHFFVFISVLALVSTMASGFLYLQYQKAQKVVNNPNLITEQETRKLVKQVSNLMILPTDEKPTLATVTDSNKLKDQNFFKNSVNGDKLLIYSKAKLAVLFSLKLNKIIAVSSLNTNSQPEVAGVNSGTSLKLAVYNGSQTPLSLTEAEQRIKKNFDNLIVTTKAVAKKNYKSTLVVDFTGNKGIASSLAQLLNGEVGSLPEGETVPSGVDMLVILGK